jgi:parvulin-like peptidyl-prolyl isomerase
LAIGFGLVIWKKKVDSAPHMSFNNVSREEIELLLADVKKANPTALKRLAENPENRKKQLESLKQMMAFASQAKKEGLADEPANKQELENIRVEVLAVNYDREVNKDKGPMPPFGFIGEEQITAYWEGTAPQSTPTFWDKIGLGEKTETRSHEDEFIDFLNAKIELLKAQNPEMKDREISEEEKTQARDIFAKTRIYKAEYEQKAKSGELPAEFVKKANLQVKLQQASFLMGLYSKKVADQMKVTDEEVDQYIAAHPELSPAEKRTKAQQILDRAKAGEDFAALANEFTEDPGNKGPDGKTNGGLYADVPKGRMVAPFETAALGLEAGQVAPELVETDFGFHIIKLERKLGPTPKREKKEGEAPAPEGETYDVRHILISTMAKDPDDPNAREMPVKDFVRNKLETEKEKKLLDEIVASNGVTVAEDFTIPTVTDEEIQQMQQKQRMPQMPPDGAPPADAPPGNAPAANSKSAVEPKKPEGKKK